MIEKNQRFSQCTTSSHQNECIRNSEMIIEDGDDYDDDIQTDDNQTKR